MNRELLSKATELKWRIDELTNLIEQITSYGPSPEDGNRVNFVIPSTDMMKGGVPGGDYGFNANSFRFLMDTDVLNKISAKYWKKCLKHLTVKLAIAKAEFDKMPCEN